MPTCLADVAAPIQKLWMLNWDESICSSSNALSRALLKACLVNHLPLENRNNGPGVLPRLDRYCTRACTGHTAWPVFPKYIRVPFLNWSPFDCLILTCMSDGDARLSKATSDNRRSFRGSKKWDNDAVNLLTLSKQQNSKLPRSLCP